MIKHINDVDINYIDYGEGKNTLVFLHGWGQNIDMMKPLGDRLKKNNRILILDLPGFGLSSEPKTIWSVDDYVECIRKFLLELEIDNPILVGHSFGGKISLLYSSLYKVDKLIVFGSPYKKEVQKVSTKIKILKSMKKIPILNGLEGFVKKHIGSTDYRNASKVMRSVLVKTVNYDITDSVKKIKCPTLIIWGSMDKEVSISDAYALEKLIDDAGVIEYPGCSHYAYLERLEQTIIVLKNFIGGKE